MTIEELIVYGKERVESMHAKIVLADLLNRNPLELYNILEQEISTDTVDIYKSRIDAIVSKKPLQYVLGNVNFYGNIFLINENVLIPRFETEEVVEKAIAKIKEKFPDQRDLKIIDIGTGSGVIGLTLKHKFQDSIVTLVDISKEALDVAENNSKRLNLPVTLIESNMLENVTEIYDVLISNPPYIKEDEQIDDLVYNNEPHLALYAGEDGLDCYRQILSTCKCKLNQNALIVFEIGNTQAAEITLLAHEYLDDITVEVYQDLQGRDRIMTIEI